MAQSSSTASRRINLDPQAAHCAAYDEILSRYVDHYYVRHQPIGLDEDVRVEYFIALAGQTYGISNEFVSAVNMDLDVDWGDCLNVGEASGAWTYDPKSDLVYISISPSIVHACERLAQRFSNPW